MKLRQKNTGGVNKLIENYTVGEDYLRDMQLLPYDIQASLAHVAMLHHIGLLQYHEKEQLETGLKTIKNLWKDGEFIIRREQEDGHTAIEERLTKEYGDLGKKIHTGRSRNDQILVTMRLHILYTHGQLKKQLTKVLQSLVEKKQQRGNISMPGYTHMQKAMPTTVDTRLGSYHDAYQDLLDNQWLENILDQNPLGSVAGFGETNLGIDRDYTTKQLGFTKTQKNPLYCAMSRGLFENYFLQHRGNVFFVTQKLVIDLIFFTTSECNYFSLPSQYTTGSSVMPQKKNYDVLELVRAKYTLYQGYQQQIQQSINGLISGYHRDFQLSKGAYFESIILIQSTLEVMTKIIQALSCNVAILKQACTPEIYATEQAYELVKQGIPFREAYQIIGKKYNKKNPN